MKKKCLFCKKIYDSSLTTYNYQKKISVQKFYLCKSCKVFIQPKLIKGPDSIYIYQNYRQNRGRKFSTFIAQINDRNQEAKYL